MCNPIPSRRDWRVCPGIILSPAPFRVPVTHAGRKGLILLDQLRAVDKVRLAKRLGAVSTKTLVGTLGTLQEVFSR